MMHWARWTVCSIGHRRWRWGDGHYARSWRRWRRRRCVRHPSHVGIWHPHRDPRRALLLIVRFVVVRRLGMRGRRRRRRRRSRSGLVLHYELPRRWRRRHGWARPRCDGGLRRALRQGIVPRLHERQSRTRFLFPGLCSMALSKGSSLLEVGAFAGVACEKVARLCGCLGREGGGQGVPILAVDSE